MSHKRPRATVRAPKGPRASIIANVDPQVAQQFVQPAQPPQATSASNYQPFAIVSDRFVD